MRALAAVALTPTFLSVLVGTGQQFAIDATRQTGAISPAPVPCFANVTSVRARWRCLSGKLADTHRVKVNVASAIAASALLDEDFSSYSSTALLMANGTLGFHIDLPTYDSLALDTTTGFGASRHSLKITYGDRDTVDSTNPRVIVAFRLQGRGDWQVRRELWIEGVAKFSGNWRTDWGSPNNADHKFILAVPSSVLDPGTATGRYSLKLGVYDVANGGPQIYHSAYRVGHTDELYYGQPHAAAGVHPWDGGWHTYRMHVRFDPATGEHLNQVWVDGRPWHTVQGTGFLPMASECFSEILFGANLNESPTQSISFWWGRLRVYDHDPGW